MTNFPDADNCGCDELFRLSNGGFADEDCSIGFSPLKLLGRQYTIGSRSHVLSQLTVSPVTSSARPVITGSSVWINLDVMGRRTDWNGMDNMTIPRPCTISTRPLYPSYLNPG